MAKLYAGLIISYLLCSCVERPLELSPEPIGPTLAVVSLLQDGLPLEVYVSNTLPLTADVIDHSVTNASVILYRQGEPEIKLRYDSLYEYGLDTVRQSSGFSESRYISEDPVEVQYGDYYELEVSVPGYPPVRSEAVLAEKKLNNVVLNVFVKDTIEMGYIRDSLGREVIGPRQAFRLDSLALGYTAVNISEDKVYLRRIYRNPRLGYSSERIPHRPYRRDVYDLPSNSFPGRVFANPVFGNSISSGELEGYSHWGFYIELIRRPAEYLAFYDALSASTGWAVTGLYAPSIAPVPSNISGGYGFFGVVESYGVEVLVE